MNQANAQLYINTTGRIKKSSRRNRRYWSIPGKSVGTVSRCGEKKTGKKALWKVINGNVAYTGHKKGR